MHDKARKKLISAEIGIKKLISAEIGIKSQLSGNSEKNQAKPT